MRCDEHVRPLADAEDTQELQRVVVESGRGAFAHRELDLFVRALGLEGRIQSADSLDDVLRAQRP